MTRPTRLPLSHAALAARAAPLVEAGVLSLDGLCLVDVLARGMDLGDEAVEPLVWAALALEAGQRGHSALPATELDRFVPPREAPENDDEAPPSPALPWPTDLDGLRESPLCSLPTPLLEVHTTSEGPVVQTRRLAKEEDWVAEALVALAAPVPTDQPGFLRPSSESLAAGRALFQTPDHPAHAVLDALAGRRLGIVTGGPGTGKTWSIKRVLAMLLHAAEEQGRELSIQLAAPTGKAGVRMREAMAEGLDQLAVSASIQARLGALPSATLHRLLRVRPDAQSSPYGPDAPLPADVVVVDEASMVDLRLMRLLLRAIGPTTRLILLGDRDQLPSVDVGSVFSDVVAQPLRAERTGDPSQGGPLAPVLARFWKNHRSEKAQTLALLVERLQAADDPAGRDALPLLTEQETAPGEAIDQRIRHVLPAGHAGRLDRAQLDALVVPWSEDTLRLGPSDAPTVHRGYLSLLAELFRGTDAERMRTIGTQAPALLAAFDRYRILAVHRRGPLGVSGLTRGVETRLRAALQDAWAGKDDSRRLPSRSGHWLGQSVLVTRNAYDVDLWNGDVGLILPDPTRRGRLAAAFPAAPDSDRDHRFVPLDRLPDHSSGFVMTIHKSQGSQFDHVAVVLSSRPSPLQTRELVYTGITRASQRVSWVGTEEAMAAALGRRVVRGSLLEQRLATASPGAAPW